MRQEKGLVTRGHDSQIRHDQALRFSELFLVMIESKEVGRLHHEGTRNVKDVKSSMAPLEGACLRDAIGLLEAIGEVRHLQLKTPTRKIHAKLSFKSRGITFCD